jgi:hypothetical protein
MEKSNYENLDQMRLAIQQQQPTPVASSAPRPTKFDNIMGNLSNFLLTATSTAVTMDDIINGNRGAAAGTQQLSPQQQLALMQAQRSSFGAGSMTKIAIFGGVTIIGGSIAYALLKKKGK